MLYTGMWEVGMRGGCRANNDGECPESGRLHGAPGALVDGSSIGFESVDA